MAKRSRLDFSKYTPSWMQEQDSPTGGPEDLIARIESETGQPMSAMEKDRLIRDMLSGMTFDNSIGQSGGTGSEKSKLDFSKYQPSWVDSLPEPRARQEEPAAAPVLPVKAAEPAEEKGYWASRMDELGNQLDEIKTLGTVAKGGLQRTAASAMETMADSKNPFVQATAYDIAAAAHLADAAESGDLGKALDVITGKTKAVASASEIMRTASGENVEQGEALRSSLDKRDWVQREVGGGLLDAAGSPSSALSIIGGPLGAATIADVYAQSYADARRDGVPADQAEIYAWSQAAPESISMIPAGKLLERIPYLGKLVKGAAKKVEGELFEKLANPNIKAALTVAKTTAGESVEEATSGGLQDLANMALAGQERWKELRGYADENAPKTLDQFLANRYRDARAGAVMGAGGSLIEARGDYKESQAADAERLSQLATGSGRVSADALNAAGAERNMARTDSALDIVDAAEEVSKQEEIDRAYEGDKYSAERKAAEEEAAQRTIERQRTADKLAQNPAVTVAPPKPVTPEEVQAEWQQTKESEDARLDRVELGAEAERVRARQKLAADRAAAEEAAKADSARKAEAATKRLKTIHENKIRDEVVAANPDMDPLEVAKLTRQAIQDNPFVPPAPKPAATAPAAAPAPVAAPAKPVVAPTAAPSPAPAQEATVVPGTQSEIDDLSAQLGLGPKKPTTLAMKRSAKAEPKVDPESFAGKHLRALKALVARKTQTSTDVQNLAMQGKIVFAPNAKSLNREEDGSAAEYDVTTGKMYVYLDHANPDDVGGIIVRALHESTHAGQFNDRTGRSSVLQQMMSKEKYSAAAKKIRDAAKSGNKLAQRAVAKAQAAAAEDASLDQLELVPYFVGEVADSRENTSLGRLGGVARDIRKAGRDFLREKLGMDLDLTMNDIHSASMNVAGEIVKSDIKGTKTPAQALKMIGGQSGKGFGDADFIYAGKVDGKLRYEISDEDAGWNENGFMDMVNGYSVPLGELLNHESLYENYPQAKSLLVRMTNTNGSLGIYLGQKQGIKLSDELRFQYDTALQYLLHEVQHYVQDLEGFVPGESNKRLLPKGPQVEYDRAEKAYKQALTQFDLGFAVSKLPPVPRGTWDKLVANKHKLADWVGLDNAPITPTEMSRWFIEGSYAGATGNGEVRRQAERYIRAKEALAKAQRELREAEDLAFQTYERNYGEAEARNTETRRNYTDAQRRANPPETTMGMDRPGGVTVDETLDTGRVPDGKPLTRLRMAGDGSGRAVPVTETQQFKDWFRNSKAVDENGKPKVLYHGTAAATNFDEFRRSYKDLGMHFGTKAQANHPRFMDPLENGSISNARILPVYLSIQNPFRMEDVFGDATGRKLVGHIQWGAARGTLQPTQRELEKLHSFIGKYGDPTDLGGLHEAVIALIKNRGYDSVVYENRGEPEYTEYGTNPDGTIDYFDVKDEVFADSYIVFEPNQVKSAVGNAGSFDPKSPSILKMANPSLAPELPFTRKIPPVISAFFSSSAGAGKVAREIIEHAVASPAGERMLAEGTVGQYREGVQKIAAQRGVTAEVINKEIAEKLDAIDKREDDYDTNLAAFTAVANQYGQAGEALLKFRKQTDDLSFEMIRERAAQGTPLTSAEVETYTTIRNNMGRYAHRQYAVHMGKGGEKYAKTIFKDYEKYLKTAGANASEKVKNNYQRVADAVRHIVDNNLVIPSDEALMEMNATEVKRLFDVWGAKTNPQAYSLSQQRSILSDMRDSVNANTDEMTATAENIVRQIIGLVAPTSPIATAFRGGKVDQSILKERSWLAPEIRKLMGEIEDPAMRLFSTVAKQTEFIARTRMLKELRDSVGPEHLQPPGSSGRPAVKGMVQLKEEAYGPLQNHFVSQNLANLLSSHIQQLATFEQAVAMAITRPSALGGLAATTAVQTWGNVAGKAKMLQIVGKPINFLINFVGGPRSMLINGNLNPVHLGKAMQTAAHIIAYSVDPSKSSAEARRVTTVGVTDSAFVGEINAEVYAELNKVLKQMQGKPEKEALEMFRKFALFAKEGYAMMDVVYKIANFYQQADAVLPEYYKAAGEKKTQAQIDREAADIVNGTNVTYKRAAPIIKNLERYGITQFGTFFYEVFRSEVNNVKQGLAEMKRGAEAPNKEAAAVMYAQGARRLLGQLTAWGATAALARGLAGLVFGDDEDKEEKLRALLPDYLRNQDFVIFGKDKDGKSVLFDWSRVDPSGPMTDIMRTMLNQDGDLDKIGSEIFQLYVAPRLGSRIIEAAATTTGAQHKKIPDPLVKELFPSTFEGLLNTANKLGVEDNTVKAWALVGETFLPGITSGWSKSNARPVMEDGVSTVAALATYAGARMYTLDNPRALNTAAFDHVTALKENRSDIAQYFNEHPNTTLEQVVDNMGDLREKEKESFDQLKLTYDGMIAIGHTPSEVAALLKAKKVSAQTIGDLRRGNFEFRSFSKKSIDGFKKAELVGKTLAEKREINAKWKAASDMLRASATQLDEEN